MSTPRTPDISSPNPVFDALSTDIFCGTFDFDMDTPGGVQKRSILLEILIETNAGNISPEEAESLYTILSASLRQAGQRISIMDLQCIHQEGLADTNTLHHLASLFLDDQDSKLYEDELKNMGMDRRSLDTMVLNFADILPPAAQKPATMPIIARSRKNIKVVLAAAGALIAIGGAALLLKTLPNKSEDKAPAVKAPADDKKDAPATIAEAVTEAVDASPSAPATPTELPAPETPAPAPVAPEAPSSLSVPVFMKSTGHGGKMFNEEKSVAAWKASGYEVSTEALPNGKKLFVLKDSNGNKFGVDISGVQVDTPSIEAKRQ